MVKPINESNPLIRYMRQPKIYVTLPSKGKFWPEGSFVIPENEELPIYSMTAKDELMFKTPDALMNGQSVVDVIQSCVPSIKNAWNCPSIDLDLILVAIRIATYGSTLKLTAKIPNTTEEGDYEIDLHPYVDHANTITWIEQVPISDDLIVFVKPLTYKHMTAISQKGFETNKVLQIAGDSRYSEAEKTNMIKESFENLTNLTTDMVVNSISKIKAGEQDVTELRFIKEFIQNSDRSLVDTIQKHINALKKQNEFKPVTVSSTPQQQELGAPSTFEIPVNFDNSSFFA